MRLYKQTESTVRPLDIELTESEVFIAKNIKEVAATEERDAQFVFDYYVYSKNEYLLLLQEENQKLNEQILNTQIALCDIYELIEGESNG